MKFGSLDGGADGEYYGTDFVEISQKFVWQNTFFALDQGHLTD